MIVSVSLRHAALALALLVPAAATATPQSTAPATKLEKSQAGFYRFKVGALDVIALSDGTLPLDTKVLHKDPATVAALLRQSYAASPVDASVNAFLIPIDHRLVLVDAGAGELYGPTLNKLPAALRAAGYAPEQVTDILITHIHTDHSGGLMDGNRRVFPNAIVHVDKRELEFWLTPANLDKLPPAQRTLFARLFEEARVKMTPYVTAGKVKTFEGATQLFSAIRTVSAPGHTPGHTFYVVESRGEKLVFWGDILHVAEAQLPDPSITIDFDLDPKAAGAQRAKVFAEAAQQGYLVAPAHIAFPGVGHLRSDGAGYRWIPVPYVNDAVLPTR